MEKQKERGDESTYVPTEKSNRSREAIALKLERQTVGC